MQQAVHRAIIASRDSLAPLLNATSPMGSAAMGANVPSGTTVTFTNTHFASFLVLMPVSFLSGKPQEKFWTDFDSLIGDAVVHKAQ